VQSIHSLLAQVHALWTGYSPQSAAMSLDTAVAGRAQSRLEGYHLPVLAILRVRAVMGRLDECAVLEVERWFNVGSAVVMLAYVKAFALTLVGRATHSEFSS
jgi:hypothetical protein